MLKRWSSGSFTCRGFLRSANPALTTVTKSGPALARDLHAFLWLSILADLAWGHAMLKFQSLPILPGAAALVLVAGLATSASADIISYGPGSPIDVSGSGIDGVGTFTFSPTPATEIFAITGTDFTTDFPNQDPTTVASGVAAVFEVSTPTLTANNESLSNPFTENDPTGYNYVAIHNDSGEIVFFYDTSQTTFTLNNSSGALSNARFYACEADQAGCSNVPAPAPPIGRGLPVLLAVGGLLFGSKLWERSIKRASRGVAGAEAAV